MVVVIVAVVVIATVIVYLNIRVEYEKYACEKMSKFIICT